eukprot:TRINITY_DN3482_c0_g1_i11.p1 TRINITY_DN3482_c0_g1~~TRINITY_DN3482_c0_g1_i11.p1  ORF type:complete len:107 (+),score=8.84 TRINITY_DN3482_c0_g1_i11:35-355(+)
MQQQLNQVFCWNVHCVHRGIFFGEMFIFESLKTISNMSALSNVTSIGKCFLEECSSLESVDLSCFVNVTVIKNTFLQDCSSLMTISNMSALSNVTSIGDYECDQHW